MSNAKACREQRPLSVVVGKRRVGKTRLLKEPFFSAQDGKEGSVPVHQPKK